MNKNTMVGAWKSRILPDGTALDINMDEAPMPATVWVRPGSGDTVTISYSCDDGTTFTTWAAGAVTVYTESVFDSGVTHIRGQRTAGGGAESAFGVC